MYFRSYNPESLTSKLWRTLSINKKFLRPWPRAEMASATGENFFEGTEKLLEVWFTSSIEETKPDLRAIER